jgi:hypothetical protein
VDAVNRYGSGVGLHVGDREVCVARHDGEGVVVHSQPALMALVSPEALSGTPWEQNQVHYSGEALLVGKSVLEARGIPAVGAGTMPCGRLDIHRPPAEFALGRLLEHLLGLGPAPAPGHPCVVAEPAPAIGFGREPLFHATVLQDVVRTLGYSPYGVEEGRAVALAQNGNAETNLLAFSCDDRFVHGCLSCHGITGINFSMEPGGSWIDEQVAMALEVPLDDVRRIRKSCHRILIPQSRAEEAVLVYSRAFVQRMWKRLSKFLEEQGTPLFSDPVDAVWAGPWRVPEDFGELLLRESRNTGFCVPFRSIRSSKEGPTAVARGCLEVARRLEEEMRPGRAT